MDATSKPFPDSPSFNVVATLAAIPNPATPEFQERPYAGKTVPEGLAAVDYDSSGSDEEEKLEKEVVRLRAQLNALQQPRKKRRYVFKAGSPQVRYVMRALQTCYNTQSKQLEGHTDKSPGQEARALLVRLLNNFMVQLDEESHYEGFDWRAVPDRPHAKKIKFALD